MDTETFDAVFWTFVITSCIGCLLGLTKIIYNSKCKSCKFCCCYLVRDVEGEEKIDVLELENHKVKNEEKV
jgi:hypothetical protein